MRHYFGAFALEVISGWAFGYGIDSINEPKHPIVLNAKKFFSIDFSFSMITSIIAPKLASLLKLNFFDKEAFNFYEKLVNQIIIKTKEMNGQNGKHISSDIFLL